MAYQPLYSLNFNNLAGDWCELEIEEDGTIVQQSLVCAHSPVEITWDTASDDIFAPVNGSRAMIKMIATTTFQFRSLYTGSPRKYRVSLYIADEGDSSGAKELWWRGFFHPEQGGGEYNQAPTSHAYLASDQLGYLKNISWDRETPESELSALGAILDKTGLDFNLWESINLYEQSHADADSDSPLSQTYFNPVVFDGMTYYDALTQLLFKYHAIIKQSKGVWKIYRPKDSGEAYISRYYTFSGGVFTYSTNASYDPVVDTTVANSAFSSKVRIAGKDSSFDISPAWNRYKLNQDWGLLESIFKNPDFKDGRNPIPENWYISGVPTDCYRDPEGYKMISAAVQNTYFFQRVFGVTSPLCRWTIEWSAYIPNGETLDVEFAVICYDKNTRVALYWDFDEGYWTFGSSGIKTYKQTYDLTGDDSAVWKQDSVSFITYPTSVYIQDIQITLIRPVGTSTNSFVIWKYAGAQPTPATLVTQTTEYSEGKLHDIIINDEALNDAGEFKVLLSDGPRTVDLPGGGSIPPLSVQLKYVYSGLLFLDVGLSVPTVKWKKPTETSLVADSLVNRMMQDYSWYYINPAEILKVTIYSKILLPSSVLQEVTGTTNRLYMIKEATWDVKYCKWIVNAYEIGTGPGPALLAEDELELQAEDGQVLRGEGIN